jgi:hypothetical protein
MVSKFRKDPDRYLWMQPWKPKICIFHRPLSYAAKFFRINRKLLEIERSPFVGSGTWLPTRTNRAMPAAFTWRVFS